MDQLPTADSSVLTPPVLTEAPGPAASPPAPTTARVQTRLWSLMVFAICASMLGLGAWMTPSPSGVGTHADNLHLPPCGWLKMTGYPCPTCGCTTSVTWLAHGNIIKSITTQPFGTFVGLIAAWIGFCALVGMATGKWIGPSAFWLQWHANRLLLGTGAILLAAWVYKIVAMKHGW